MPKALNVDWNLAQALYIQGVQYPAIAEKVGVTQVSLRQRVSRYKWAELKQDALKTVSQVVTGHDGRTLVERSKVVRSALGKAVEAQAKAIAAVTDPKLADLGNTPAGQGQAAVLRTVAESASNVFGWGNEQRGSLIRLDFYEQDLAQQQAAALEVVEVPVIPGKM